MVLISEAEPVMAWYREFFDEWYLKYWIQWITPQFTGREVDAIERYLELKPGARVLDLCCGQGRHSLELARRGYRVVGYDLSETLLGESRRLALAEGLDIQFVRGDMQHLPFDGEFDGAFNFYTAFGYFEHDEENQAVLDGIGRALRLGGRFLLDYPCLEGRMIDWKTKNFTEFDDGTVMLHELIHHVFEQTIENKVLYITKDNRRHRTGFTLRHYYGRELRSCLAKAGLKVIDTLGSLEGAALTNRDRRILLVSEKT